MSRILHRLLSGTVALGAAIGFHLASAEAAAPRPKRHDPFNVPTRATLTVPPKPKPTRAPAQAAAPQGPLLAVVSLAAQTISLYAGTTLIAHAPISSGMDGHKTPTGIFAILQKNRYHESNIYSGAPMPFMQRLTWSGIAMHAGNLPGYRASHGCVRLPYDFSERLFALTRMGGRVIVTHEVVAPQAIAHAGLPLPVMTPAAPTPAVAASAFLPAPPLALASTTPGAAETVAVRLLNPVQAAEIEKRRLAEVQLEARGKANAALEAARLAARTSDAADAATARLERQVTAFVEMAEKARARVAAAAADDEARIQAEASQFAAEEAIEDAKAALVAAKTAERRAYDDSFEAARLARDLEDRADAADADVKLASRGHEPVTVFVSRKEGKVLVRQGGQTILEGGVAFRDPHLPLGTHVFTALSAAEDNSLSWTSVSIADGATARQPAASALERIAIDAELASEIGKRLWVGATMIISDQGVGSETSKGTDFIVQTR